MSTLPPTAKVNIKKGRAVRNNNPGNIKSSNMGTGKKDEEGFVIFNTPEEGWAGLERQIKLDMDRGDTVRTFIEEYAPEKDGNDTEGYVRFIVERMGVKEDTKLSELDVFEVAKAVAWMESNTIVEGV